jgi:cobalt-zinc-cadmium efflux system membrane fusion protein
MNRSRPWLPSTLILILLLLHPELGTTAELTLSAAEVETLGIELAVPQATERSTGVAGRGRVVIPPAGDLTVSAPQAGLLVRLHVATGDSVRSGQLVAAVRSPGFLAAQREFLDALSAYRLARARLARDRSLVAEGIASRRRLETTEAEARAAAAALDEHRQMLRIAGLGEAEIDTLAEARELKGLLPVRAPIDGVVLEMNARAGTTVAETDSIYRIGDLSTLWLEIAVPQSRAQRIAPGMPVAVAGSTAAARVESVGRAVDPKTQMVTVRATVAREAADLRPGQFISARILDGPADGGPASVWTVPVSSVVRSGDRHFVFVRSAAGFSVQPVEHLGVEGDRAVIAGDDLDRTSRLAAAGVSALKAIWGGAADEGV